MCIVDIMNFQEGNTWCFPNFFKPGTPFLSEHLIKFLFCDTHIGKQ